MANQIRATIYMDKNMMDCKCRDCNDRDRVGNSLAMNNRMDNMGTGS